MKTSRISKLLIILFAMVILMSLLSSCCPSQKVAERRISRLVECNPSLKEGKADTVEIRVIDTVFIDPITITKDTTLIDTLWLEKDGATAQIVRQRTGSPCDTAEIKLGLSFRCPPDTVIRDTIFRAPITTDQINVTDNRGGGFWSRLKDMISFLIIGIIIGAILISVLKVRL